MCSHLFHVRNQFRAKLVGTVDEQTTDKTRQTIVFSDEININITQRTVLETTLEKQIATINTSQFPKDGYRD